MPTIYTDLARACDSIARRRPAWLNDPTLRQLTGVAAGTNPVDVVVDAIRSYRSDDAGSDRAVLALLAVARDWPDAFTVLLYALAPVLRTRMGRSATEEYRSDALVDLLFVIRDAIDRDDLAHQRCLALRLVKRAHNRVHKRNRRPQPTTWSPEWLELAASGRPTGTSDVADEAVARADLGRFTRAVRQAVETGALPVGGWTAFRDHRLGGTLTERRSPSTASQRAIAARTARRLAPYVELHLAGHAA